MSDIERVAPRSAVFNGNLADRRQAGRRSRELSTVELRTMVRIADAQGEGLVQAIKLQEIDALTREAITGQALLAKWRDTLAGSDPLLADELRFFTDIARMGKGEIIADTIDTYCRESRS